MEFVERGRQFTVDNYGLRHEYGAVGVPVGVWTDDVELDLELLEHPNCPTDTRSWGVSLGRVTEETELHHAVRAVEQFLTFPDVPVDLADPLIDCRRQGSAGVQRVTDTDLEAHCDCLGRLIAECG